MGGEERRKDGRKKEGRTDGLSLMALFYNLFKPHSALGLSQCV